MLAIITFSAGCAAPPAQPPPQSVSSSPAPVLYAPANATITPTPFQPLPITPTFIPTEYPNNVVRPTTSVLRSPSLPQLENTWGRFSGPSAYPPSPIPPPASLFRQPAGQTTILLMGSDQRLYEGGFRTDTMLLLTLNPELGTASLTSFPRDLFVYIPGWTMERINTAQARGGFELTALTFEYNFGIRPDYWVLINFSGFVSVINSLGGITVQVGSTLTDRRDSIENYTVYAGTVQMDGDTALWYVRARYTTSDFDRSRRQQEVMQAIFFKVISLDGITRAPEFYSTYQSAMITDLSIDTILPLLPLASQLAVSRNINRYSIGSSQVTAWIDPYSGAQVLLPIQSAVMDILTQALNAP